MKKLAGALLALWVGAAQAKDLGAPLWETAGLRTPESVLVHELDGRRVLLVSEIEGDAAARDGAGGIALLSATGEMLDRDFVRGLNAPKGMAVHGDILYVADIDELVAIDLSARKVIARHRPTGARFLNDVAADKSGAIYASDSRAGIVFRLVRGRIETHAAGIPDVNGLYATDQALLIGAQRKVLQLRGGKLTEITSEFEAGIDGLEMLPAGGYVATAWVGLIYHVSASGEVTELLDSRSPQMNTADIDYDAATQTLYVPTFLANSVRAYALRLSNE